MHVNFIPKVDCKLAKFDHGVVHSEVVVGLKVLIPFRDGMDGISMT